MRGGLLATLEIWSRINRMDKAALAAAPAVKDVCFLLWYFPSVEHDALDDHKQGSFPEVRWNFPHRYSRSDE